MKLIVNIVGNDIPVSVVDEISYRCFRNHHIHIKFPGNKINHDVGQAIVYTKFDITIKGGLLFCY